MNTKLTKLAVAIGKRRDQIDSALSEVIDSADRLLSSDIHDNEGVAGNIWLYMKKAVKSLLGVIGGIGWLPLTFKAQMGTLTPSGPEIMTFLANYTCFGAFGGLLTAGVISAVVYWLLDTAASKLDTRTNKEKTEPVKVALKALSDQAQLVRMSLLVHKDNPLCYIGHLQLLDEVEPNDYVNAAAKSRIEDLNAKVANTNGHMEALMAEASEALGIITEQDVKDFVNNTDMLALQGLYGDVCEEDEFDATNEGVKSDSDDNMVLMEEYLNCIASNIGFSFKVEKF